MRIVSITTGLLCLSLALGCSDDRTRQLNRVSKQIIEGAKNSKETLSEGYRSLKEVELPDASSIPTIEDVSATSEQLVENASTAAAEKAVEKVQGEFSEKVDTAAEAVGDVKQVARQGSETARAKVRWVARRTPRSEREAQKLVQSVGQDWTLEFREWMKSLSGRGGLFEQRNRESGGKKRSS